MAVRARVKSSPPPAALQHPAAAVGGAALVAAGAGALVLMRRRKRAGPRQKGPSRPGRTAVDGHFSRGYAGPMSEDGGSVGRARRATVRAARAARNVEEFFDAVMTALAPVLPSDIWAGVTVDPATLMNTGGNYRHGVPESLMPRMLDIEYREGDVNLLPDLARRPSPVGLLSREAGDLLAGSPRYRDIIRPLGCRDELRVALRDRHGVWGALILGRGRDAPAFDDIDLATAASLAQPLGDALRRLHVTRQAWRNPAPTAPSTTGIRCCTRAPRPVRGSASCWATTALRSAAGTPVRRLPCAPRPPRSAPRRRPADRSRPRPTPARSARRGCTRGRCPRATAHPGPWARTRQS